jgi:type VI secretion system protein ImpL
MGIVNHGLKKDPMGLVSDCFRTMGERIRDIRLLTMQKLQKKEISPELILFPSELEKIRPGFEAFIKGVFQENPYQETPFFRGINFSSGCQEGTPYSHFLKDLGLIGEREVLPGTSRGLFLHDFFSGLLPSDRGLFKVTQRGAAWKRLTRNIGFAAWTAIIIAVCGILSFSFVKNLQTIKTASVDFAGSQILQGELISDISTLEKFGTAIRNVEKSNGRWWIPRLGLNESINVEVELKKKYCTLMEKRFIEPFDKKMADNMAYFNLSTPIDFSIRHVDHLVKRINIIKARLLKQSIEELEKMKQPVFNTVEIGGRPDITEDIQLKIRDLYLYYLFWQDDTQNMNRKMNDLQKWLARILSIKGSNLNWLVIWTDSDPQLSPYKLADFWGKPALEVSDSKAVTASFTLKGKEKIEGFINEIEAALTNPLILAAQKREFYKWYKTAYLAAWLNFTADFTRGKKALITREQWQNISDSVWHKKGPYFSLLQTVSSELKLFSGQKELPDWTNLVKDINNLHGQAAAIKARKSATTGVLGKAASTVKSKLSRVSGRLSNTINNNLSAETMMKSGKIFLTYQEALAKLPPLVSSQRAAFELATSIYTEDPATSSTPFFTANQAFNKLKATMVYSGKESSYIWKILEGPLEFYQEYALKEASCRLQKKWEEDVLMEMKDASDKSNVNTLLLGSNGFVTRFLKGPGKPFIKRGLKKGFFSAKVNGKNMDLNTYLFKFLTRGVSVSRPVKKSYSVKISGYPTSANEGVQVQPHATVLKLVCTGSTTTLENRNYPVRKVFAWSPQSECEVIFSIKIGSLTLVKKFQGPLCFPKFFRAFPNGQRKFIPSDFPDHEDDLKRMGVKYIIAKYKFKGDKSIARLLRSAPGRLPTEIVKCWE